MSDAVQWINPGPVDEFWDDQSSFPFELVERPSRAVGLLTEDVDGTLRLYTRTNLLGGCCDHCRRATPWPKRYAWLTEEQLQVMLAGVRL